MTETSKSAEKQPDQADPQKGLETPGKTGADQRRVLVCQNCGHIWEVKPGTLRPQCYKCKRQRTRQATPEEIAQFDQGITKIAQIPSTDSGLKTAEHDQQNTKKQPEKPAEPADKYLDQRIDPIKLVDPPHKKADTVRIAEGKKPGASPLLLVALFLVIGGVIALFAYLSSRPHDPEPETLLDEEPETISTPVPQYGGAIPGMY